MRFRNFAEASAAYPTTQAEILAGLKQATELGVEWDSILAAVQADAQAGALRAHLRKLEEEAKAYTRAVGSMAPEQARKAWLALYNQAVAMGVGLWQYRNSASVPSNPGVAGFGAYGSLLPGRLLPGFPEGTLEVGLGALLGYLVGAGSQKGVLGAVVGGAAGLLLGQMKFSTGSAQSGYAVTARPGTTPAAATPDKAGSGFDWTSASKIIGSILTNKNLQAGVTSIASLVSKAWGSDTRAAASDVGVADASGYLPWSEEGYVVDPCANGGCVLLQNETVENAATPTDYVSI